MILMLSGLISCKVELELPGKLHHEYGTVSTAQQDKAQWHEILFTQDFQTPPIVVMGPASFNEDIPLAIVKAAHKQLHRVFRELSYNAGQNIINLLRRYLAGILEYQGIEKGLYLEYINNKE